MTKDTNSFQSFAPTTSIVQEARAEHKYEVKQEQVTPVTVRDIAFTKNNKLMADGRVFGGYDEEGRYYAVSVSPFFDEFDTQVEEGILPLIKALRTKGYLTCSSCYGHPKRAMVVICFPNDEERDKLADILSEAKIPTMDIQTRESMVNVGIKQDRNGKVKFTRELEFDHEFESHRDMETASFNQMFFRSYDSYSFLHVTLFDDYHPFLNPLKAWRTRKYLPMKDNLLKQFEKLILSEKTPYFRH